MWAITIKGRAREEKARARITIISVEEEDIGTKAKARARIKAKERAKGIKGKEREMADIKERGKGSKEPAINAASLGTLPKSAPTIIHIKDIATPVDSGVIRQEIARTERFIMWNLTRRGISP